MNARKGWLVILLATFCISAGEPMKMPDRASKFSPSERAELYETAQIVFKQSDHKKQVPFEKHLIYFQAIRWWARQHHIEKHWKVLVAMFHVESEFLNIPSNQGEDSFGIAQVRERYRSEFEARITHPIYQQMKDYSTAETQIALGVSAFKAHLLASQVDAKKENIEGVTVWAGVRYYNGKGDGGRPGKGGGFHYLQKVRTAYKRFFGE